VKPKCLLLAILLLLHIAGLRAQTARLSGTVQSEDGPLPGVSVQLLGTEQGTVTDADGQFELMNLPAGERVLELRYIGYLTVQQKVDLRAGSAQQLELNMREDILGLDAVIVTATRNEMPVHEAPVIVNRIDDRVFERTQSLSLAEGLSFSPGLRLENNCQNCGFTQLRMNGLDGPYTQVLINSRPIFSALTGVYGLEMIPANMIERVEVVRGGGSALYGGNAIAGTVNVITREPVANTFEVATQLGWTNLQMPDRTLTLNGSVVSKDGNKGLTFYGFNRERQPWDANGDGFSEITQLRNTTFGADAFFKPGEHSQIKLSLFRIREFRRGGNDFELPPHQTDITEQIDHRITGGNVSYEFFTKDLKHKFAFYASAQHTDRDSYYGGGGRVLQAGDSLTESDILALNAYGQSRDLALATGLQYTCDINDTWLLTAGSEYQYNDVLDEMPGYERAIDQQVHVLGTYAQLQFQPVEQFSILAGGRFDYVGMDGFYGLGAQNFTNDRHFPVFVPRLTAMYRPLGELKFRLAYAQGYRAPQAFDEDLHIETVGGAARFTFLSPDLELERSHSLSASGEYTLRKGRMEANFVLDGFYTRLRNPFVTAEAQELPSGISVVTKRNGGGATVSGLNAEVNLAVGSRWVFQLGGTAQAARYDQDELIWSPAEASESNLDSLVTTRNLLRTPNLYGFFTANYQPVEALNLSLSGVFTGPMDVPHVIVPDTEFTALERTPAFAELNVKVDYALPVWADFDLHLFAGMQNVLNSFQDDFDRGPDRDAGYVYGPARPRTLFAGLKMRLD